jgi:hypothetical protein
MKKLAITLGLAIIMFYGIVATVNASIESVGVPIIEGSWTQGFEEHNVGPFDLVAVQMSSAGDSFETVTHSGFSNGTWANVYENTPPVPTLASASGSPVIDLIWNIKFAGDVSNSLVFDFVAFNGTTLLESANASWNGSGWSITTGTWAPSRSDVIPEPASLIIWALFGLGSMFGVRVWRRRGIAVPATPARHQPWSDESRMAIHQIIEKGCRH